MNVSVHGYYMFASVSTMDTYGLIYKNRFSSYTASTNLIGHNDGNGDDRQFNMTLELAARTTYILIVTTSFPHVTGNFSIVASGPANISLQQMGMY